MFSICIPVYRYNALPLVRELLRQRTEIKEPGAEIEILVYDDASPDDGDWAKPELRKTTGIRYEELPGNLGRAGIRNRMAQDASGPYLILLDADAALPDGYLQRYAGYLNSLKDQGAWSFGEDLVVIGGRRYQEESPTDKSYHLHWWYGRQRESDVDSNSEGWLGFHSNNFLATRALLLRHPFSESGDGYGHEDTLWGQQFTGSEIPLFRLDNPVVHLGLEQGGDFLRKQQEAIRNLHRLKSETPHLRTRLIDLTQRYPLLLRVAKHLPEQRLIDYLSNTHRPSLYALDLLKLHWWALENDQ